MQPEHGPSEGRILLGGLPQKLSVSGKVRPPGDPRAWLPGRFEGLEGIDTPSGPGKENQSIFWRLAERKKSVPFLRPPTPPQHRPT